ncbi:MAG: hypothetical protein Q9168_007158 [Polycauliona sp. 1 TL-2023]
MTSVDLHCHICPKQPDFSDVSHLLTHVGSKGHLSNYFKAQVRSNQDASVRHQLQVYEQWYAEHEIEKLLSQRMILKDSKKANGVPKPTKREGPASAKPTKPSQTTSKKATSTAKHELAARARTEPLIDPQLSQPSTSIPSTANPHHLQSPLSSPGFDITSIHHGPYPPMRWFDAPPKKPARVGSIQQHRLKMATGETPAMEPSMLGYDTESDDDSLTRQSMEPLYPEPPHMQAIDTQLETQEIPAAPRKNGRGRPRHAKSHQDTRETEDTPIPRTPELKGIYYPGMSLFDSASAAAQKKRNQRKNESILAQIQQESLEVECNEYIYWPDGSLKMCRFITGDVQSSPFQENTPPPPPPPKRRRGRKAKTATGSTRQEKPEDTEQPGLTRSDSMYGALTVHGDLNTIASTVNDSFSPDFHNAMARHDNMEEGEEWFLDLDEAAVQSHRGFSVFSDPTMASPVMTGSPAKLRPNPLNASTSSHNSHSAESTNVTWLMSSDRSHNARQISHAASKRYSSSFTGRKMSKAQRPILGASPPRSTAWPDYERCHDQVRDGHVFNARTTAREFLTHEANVQAKPVMGFSGPAHARPWPGKENVPPPLAGSAETIVRATYGGHPPEVQKYFMMKDHQGAQTSTTLPPEMAFAGMGIPPVYRASLNPLNPNAHLRQSLPYSSNYTPFRSEQAGAPPGYRSFSADLREDSKIKKDRDHFDF